MASQIWHWMLPWMLPECCPLILVFDARIASRMLSECCPNGGQHLLNVAWILPESCLNLQNQDSDKIQARFRQDSDPSSKNLFPRFRQYSGQHSEPDLGCHLGSNSGPDLGCHQGNIQGQIWDAIWDAIWEPGAKKLKRIQQKKKNWLQDSW